MEDFLLVVGLEAKDFKESNPKTKENVCKLNPVLCEVRSESLKFMFMKNHAVVKIENLYDILREF